MHRFLALLAVAMFPHVARANCTFTEVQKAGVITNNTLTFGSNMTAGNIVITQMEGTTMTVSSVKDGNGVALTASPHTPFAYNAGSNHIWTYYTLSAGGGTKTIVTTPSTGTIGQTFGIEVSVTGCTPAFDTDNGSCSSTAPANPACSMTLGGGPVELVFASAMGCAGSLTGAGTPWTLGNTSALGYASEYQLAATGSVTTAFTPSGQGSCTAMQMAVGIPAAKSSPLFIAQGRADVLGP